MFDGRDLLRTVVLKTNAIWPLSLCNRIPYLVAAGLFVRLFERCPEIASIYLSHGFAGDDWTPGLSDIDLTVILENNLTVEAEFAFLTRFWRTFDQLKSYFPMLGEVIVLAESEFGLWQSYASTTEHGRRWVLLHGRPTAKSIRVDAEVWKKRALNAALWVYLESLPPCLSEPDTYLRRHDVARRARKILRYVNPGPNDVDGDSVEMSARALKSLEVAAIAFTDGRCTALSTREFVVVEDGLDVATLCRRFREHLSPEPDTVRPPLLTRSVREYLVRHARPYWSADPGRLECRFFTLEKIAYLLSMTRGDVLFSNSIPVALPVLERAVRDALAALLVLLEDWVGYNPAEVDATCREKYPETYRELQLVRRYSDSGQPQKARRTWFTLFSPLARRIVSAAYPVYRPTSASARD